MTQRSMIRWCVIIFFCRCGFFAFPLQTPVTGRSITAYESLDKTILDFMTQIDATAATVTVARNKQVVYSRSFGWFDRDKKRPTEPNTLMRIASVTKPITAAIIQNMINARKISLEDKAFEIISIPPPGGTIADPRIMDITIRQLWSTKADGTWSRHLTRCSGLSRFGTRCI